MTDRKTLGRVLAFLTAKFPGQGEELTGSTDLRKTILLDSLAVMEVMMFIEQEFHLTLDRRDLDEFGTPQTIADLILRKQSHS